MGRIKEYYHDEIERLYNSKEEPYPEPEFDSEIHIASGYVINSDNGCGGSQSGQQPNRNKGG